MSGRSMGQSEGVSEVRDWKEGSEVEEKARMTAPRLPDCLCIITGRGRGRAACVGDVRPALCQPTAGLGDLLLGLGVAPKPWHMCSNSLKEDEQLPCYNMC